MSREINIRNTFDGNDKIIKHKSGCTICLYPMPEFSTAYAIFGTRYGSVDTTFKTKNDADYVTVPEGIAHYLEHKLFESEECDTFELFSKTGASANAFTSFDCTAYLFSCTQNFGDNLKILLNFVQEPYFTDENVEKERGIITQEIKMYLDNPGTRVFYNCLGAVYHNNPVRIDIAGTVDSIKEIDKELLYRCYNTFYNLNNMVLSIAGNFDPEEALAICDELLKPVENQELDVAVPDEPYEVKDKRIVTKMSCAMPLFEIGFKIPYPNEPSKAYLVYSILLDVAFGRTSDFYNRLYDEGTISDSFGVDVFKGRGFFLPMISGICREPEKVTEEIINELKRLKKDGLPGDDVDIVIKMAYGQLFSVYNNVEGVAKTAMRETFNGNDVFTNVELASKITYDDVMKALMSLDLDNYSLSIVEPNQDMEG